MNAIDYIKIENILFLDIETAPNWLNFKDVPENVRTEWIYKFKFRDEAPPEPNGTGATPEANVFIWEEEQAAAIKYEAYFSNLWEKKAGLFPEFSRIVCISVGFMYQGSFYMKSYCMENEGQLLDAFFEDLRLFNEMHGAEARLCAHYGKGFDFPFIAKRSVINRKKIPAMLDDGHLKPWEKKNIDTQEVWKMGSNDGSGLPALCLAFGIPTPKDDLDGSKVSAAFHNKEFERIAHYCEADVFALLNVFKAFRLEEGLDPQLIVKR